MDKIARDQKDSSEMDDWRVKGYDPLIPPQLLLQECPLGETGRTCVARARHDAQRIVQREDDRLLVVVGPCSIHDVKAAKEYATLLKPVAERLQSELLIVMRTYFEKPRTTVGWKGLINDPDIDGSFQINKGLRLGRKLLCDLNEMGIPVAVELLDTISPQFLGDLISWGAIGARTTESQLHRELASGVSFPIGFKNGTNGCVNVAIAAMQAAAHPHFFMGVNKQGLASIAKTCGNPNVHVILRGGTEGPNYNSKSVQAAVELMSQAQVLESIMIDCSHGNSQKQCKNQPIVCTDVAQQVSQGNRHIMGVMIESNLKSGSQKVPKSGAQHLEYGVSITDECLSWEDTLPLLDKLARAVQQRRVVCTNGS